MSKLDTLVHNLRLMARLVRDYDYKEISRILREAADTIESLQALQSVSASPSAMVRLAHRLREANEDVIYLRDRLKAAEGDVGTRWHDLFGTPERAARTLSAMQKCELGIIGNCDECDMCDACRVRDGDYDALLEWLRGDA